MSPLGHLYQLKLSYQNLKKRIKKNEGYSLKPYRDQLGYLTIGYGHLILPSEKHLLSEKIKTSKLQNLFKKDFNKALNDFKLHLRVFCSNKKDAELLIEMVFQIGIKGVIKFNKLLYNMKKRNKHLVCFEMMESLWYKQTPKRVKSLIIIFLKNE